MEVNKISANTNFGAKFVIGDRRVQKFVKSSFMADSKGTFACLDKFSEIHPDAVVSISIKKSKNNFFMLATNSGSGAVEKMHLQNPDMVKFGDRSLFLDLIKKIMHKRTFWNEATF